MRVFFCLVWFSFLLLNACFAQKEENILFVGNSLTFYHDMPQTLQKMIDEQHLKIKIDQITPGGWTLAFHATHVHDTNTGPMILDRATNGEVPKTIQKIVSKHWDIVILQEATLMTLYPDYMKYSVMPALLRLDSVIKTVHAKAVLYQGYTGQKYPVRYRQSISSGFDLFFNMFVFDPKPIPGSTDPLWEKIVKFDTFICSDSFRNSGEEFQALKTVYNKMAKKINAGVAEVGYAFELCKQQYPDIMLYEGMDNEHPSIQGSYLIACVFYRYLTKKDVGNVKYCADIDKSVAGKLRKLADSLPVTN